MKWCSTPWQRKGRERKHGPRRQSNDRDVDPDRKESNMLWTIGVILLVLWLLGFLTSYTMGGLIHILLVIAIVVVLIRVIQGRRPV